MPGSELSPDDSYAHSGSAHSFEWFIGKITGLKKLEEKTYIVNDPYLNEVKYTLTVQKISVLNGDDYEWSLHIVCDNPDIHVIKVELVNCCSNPTREYKENDDVYASARYNGVLPKVVYNGTDYINFAESWNSFVEFKISRNVLN